MKNEISEIFVYVILKFSHFTNLDKEVESLIYIRISKCNSIIFLLFSKNENIWNICIATSKFSNFSNLDKGVKSLIFLQLFLH